MIPTFNHHKGITLIEVIVYVSIFSIIVFTITAFTLDMIKVKNQTKASRLTYQEARYILERINNRIRFAPGIDTGNSVFNQNPGKIVLKSPEAATNITTIAVENGQVTEQVASQTKSILSSNDVIVTNLTFRSLVASESGSTVQTTISVNYNDRGRADIRANTTLTTQASLRNDYPYAWIQTNWAGGGGAEQWEDPTKYWSNPDQNLDHSSCVGDARLGTDPDEIVLIAADACEFHGNFHLQDDPTGAKGFRGEDMPNLGLRVGGHFGNAAESSPTHYFDTSFKARSNKQYHLWARLKVVAGSDYGTSDSFYIQFSDAVAGGNPVNRIGKNQGLIVSNGNPTWAWNDIWLGAPNVGEIMTFEQSGDHEIRVQRREDGFAIDQIVLSSSRYFTSPPPNNAILTQTFARSAVLLSSKFDAGKPSVFGQLSFSALTFESISVKFQLRSSDSIQGLEQETFKGPTGPNDYYTTPNVGVNIAHDGDQAIQYRAILETSNPQTTPILHSFSLSYSN